MPPCKLACIAHLRRHIVQCATAAEGQLTFVVERQAKVPQAQCTRCSGGKEYVLWLDVAVHQLKAVKLLQHQQQRGDDLCMGTWVDLSYTFLEREDHW